MTPLARQLDDLANLHDAKIKRLEWLPADKILNLIFVDVIDPSSEPEMEFIPEELSIVCEGVLEFDMQMDSDQPTVYRCSYEQLNVDKGRVTLGIAPGGLFVVDCAMARLSRSMILRQA
jgi:hypothetical protein